MQPETSIPAHDGSGAADLVPPIERMASEIASLRKIIADLLRHAGGKDVCRGPNCQQEILFIYHRDSGKRTPYNLDGTEHLPTCADRGMFHGNSRPTPGR